MMTKRLNCSVALLGLSLVAGGCDAQLEPEASRVAEPDATSQAAALEAFTEILSPRPSDAHAYWVHFTQSQRWMEVVYSSFRSRGPQLPLLVEAGKPLHVRYSRMPGDLGQDGELRQVELFFRRGGGAVESRIVARSEHGPLDAKALRESPVTLELPPEATGTLELWFKHTLVDGREVWDSEMGQNHRFAIVPVGGTIVRFDDHWNQVPSGHLSAGRALRIAYDVDRLLPFLHDTHHHEGLTWGVTAFVSINGGAAAAYPLTANDWSVGWGGEVRPIEVALPLPLDARWVTLWFQGWAYGNTVWDSHYGANYTFTVNPPGR